MDYFIADTHFGHRNVMGFDSRPFDTIEENDRAIIDNWNSVVSEFDDVWVLGDLSWHNATKTLEILRRLNGVKHWIVGNHDRKLLKNRDIKAEFVEITNYKEIEWYGHKVVLSHYPILFWNGQHNDAILLYGHLHTTAEETIFQQTLQNYAKALNTEFYAMNVGCMMNWMDYKPRKMTELFCFDLERLI